MLLFESTIIWDKQSTDFFQFVSWFLLINVASFELYYDRKFHFLWPRTNYNSTTIEKALATKFVICHVQLLDKKKKKEKENWIGLRERVLFLMMEKQPTVQSKCSQIYVYIYVCASGCNFQPSSTIFCFSWAQLAGLLHHPAMWKTCHAKIRTTKKKEKRGKSLRQSPLLLSLLYKIRWVLMVLLWKYIRLTFLNEERAKYTARNSEHVVF